MKPLLLSTLPLILPLAGVRVQVGTTPNLPPGFIVWGQAEGNCGCPFGLAANATHGFCRFNTGRQLRPGSGTATYFGASLPTTAWFHLAATHEHDAVKLDRNGVRFGSGKRGSGLTVTGTPGSASWSFSSDRNLKDGLAPVHSAEVLDKVARLPISEWNCQDYPQRPIGPMAQDFHALFPLNDSETTLNDADLHGVALAAIQELNQKVEEQAAQLRAQEAELPALQTSVAELQEAVRRLSATAN